MKKSLSEKVAELTALRDNGQLSESDYEMLLAKAIREIETTVSFAPLTDSDSTLDSVVPLETEQESENTIIKTLSGNGVESAVKVVAILVAAVALSFGFLLPFKVSNAGGSTIDKSCKPPVVEIFRSEVNNSNYMKYGADASELRAAIANIGGPSISNKWCQNAGKDRIIVVAVVMVMSVLAVVFARRVSKF